MKIKKYKVDRNIVKEMIKDNVPEVFVKNRKINNLWDKFLIEFVKSSCDNLDKQFKKSNLAGAHYMVPSQDENDSFIIKVTAGNPMYHRITDDYFVKIIDGVNYVLEIDFPVSNQRGKVEIRLANDDIDNQRDRAIKLIKSGNVDMNKQEEYVKILPTSEVLQNE